MIRLMLSYARSGGTLLNRCLGCLQDTVVLSEVSPFHGGGGAVGNNPRTVWDQARDWFDIKLYEREYFTALQELDEICERQGRHLVLREWSYINFNPHAALPSYCPPNKLSTLEGLKERRMAYKPFVFVRDPVDIWISRKMPSPKDFFARYLRYLAAINQTGAPIFRYEDFTEAPSEVLEIICGSVGLPFSEKWRDFPYFIDVNGDTAPNKPVRKNEGEIRRLERKSIPLWGQHKLAKDVNYKMACEISGYSPTAHPEASFAPLICSAMRSGGNRFLRRRARQLAGVCQRVKRRGEKVGLFLFKGHKKAYRLLAQEKTFEVFPSDNPGNHFSVPVSDLFYHANKSYSSPFPDTIDLLVDRFPGAAADVDIIVATYGNPERARLVAENFFLLEKKSRIHIWLVETSGERAAYEALPRDKNISRVYLNTPLDSTEKKTGGRLAASNGCALSAQIGFYLGKARYVFFSHTDMMGYKENFISFLKSKLSDEVPFASFTLRHVYPFTAGAIYDKSFFEESNRADWLPLHENVIAHEKLDLLKGKIPEMKWVDAGEQLVRDALNRGKKIYVTESRGAYDAWFREARYWKNLAQKDFEGLGVEIAPIRGKREKFVQNYPELVSETVGWRISLDDLGDAVFIHRGRGISQSGRGNFWGILKKMNFRAGRV